MDVMKRAKATYRDENKSILFVQDDAWEILRSHSKWDAPEPVDLTEGDVPGVGNEDLFSEDARPVQKERLIFFKPDGDVPGGWAKPWALSSLVCGLALKHIGLLENKRLRNWENCLLGKD
ncbi:hypothetical protein Tco_1021661 [Tanacetum coccineum]